MTISWLKLTTPPRMRGGDELGDVHRRDERGGADGEAEPEARGHELPVALRERAGERADHVDAAAQDLRAPAAEMVGEPAGADRADDRAEEDRRHRELLLALVEVQVLLDEQERTADDAGVVAEQEAADRRDDRDTQDPPVACGLAEEARGLLAFARVPAAPRPGRAGRPAPRTAPCARAGSRSSHSFRTPIFLDYRMRKRRGG